ncbi:transposase [Streptomyces sp. NPDC090029]|uniref:transposase n=1 Tax=Streptomyces sp. NPDC090029 TaxID=3365924 RepID=UPI0037F2F3E9
MAPAPYPRGERCGGHLVVSKTHAGLVAAIGATLPGAFWQVPRPLRRNRLSQIPYAARSWGCLLRTVFEQPDPDAVKARMRHVLDALKAKLRKAAPVWTQRGTTLWPSRPSRTTPGGSLGRTSPPEGLNKETRRSTDTVRILPDRTAMIRLAGAVGSSTIGSAISEIRELPTKRGVTVPDRPALRLCRRAGHPTQARHRTHARPHDGLLSDPSAGHPRRHAAEKPVNLSP